MNNGFENKPPLLWTVVEAIVLPPKIEKAKAIVCLGQNKT
jgi:hypothetical protein